jgi:cell division protein FtsB
MAGKRGVGMKCNVCGEELKRLIDIGYMTHGHCERKAYEEYLKLKTTIEDLQQENEQLKSTILLDVVNSGIVKTYDGSALDKADQYIERLEKENEQLQAQNAVMREALEQNHIKGYAEIILSDTPTDYHNPADVEALKQARDIFKAIKVPYKPIDDVLAAIDKAIGGKEDV